jgi:hypothetical protein
LSVGGVHLKVLIKGSLNTLSFLFQATGAVFLIVGLWIALKLHKYLELDSDVSSAIPLFFSGLGLSVLVVASAACQCAVKGAAPKLYIVSHSKMSQKFLL